VSGSFRLKVAATPWVTVASRPQMGPVDAKSKARSVSFSQPRATEKGTAIVVVEDYLDHDTRIMAFDRAG
jgi:hypothetical protein